MITTCTPALFDFVNNTNTSLQNLKSAIDSEMGQKWLLQVKIFFSTFGVFCNSLAFIGLKEKSKKIRAPDLLLLNLTWWDTMFLSSRACQHIVGALFTHCTSRLICRAMYFAYQILNYIARTTFITSMLSTIPIAVERCLFSFMPIKVTSYDSKKRTRFILCIVGGLSLIVSIPEMMTVVCVFHLLSDDNFTLKPNSSWPMCAPTSFDNIVMSGVLVRLIFKILAWITLLVLDSILIQRLLLGARMARRMYDDDRGHLSHPRSYNERSLTVAVMALVLMALVAYPVTGIVWALTYINSGWTGLLDPRTTPEIQEVGRIVQLIYASSNLFFLLMFGTRFRRNLVSRMHPFIKSCHRENSRK